MMAFINFVKYSAIQINKILISGLMYHATMRIRLTTQKAIQLVEFIFSVILDYDINYINPNFGEYVPSDYGMQEIIPTAQNQSMATRLFMLERCSDEVSVCSKININKIYPSFTTCTRTLLHK